MTGVIHRAATMAAVLLAAAALDAQAAPPNPMTPQAALERLFRQPLKKAWFAPAFLAQVPIERVATIIDGFTGRFGGLTKVSGSGSRYVVSLDGADIDTRIALDDLGRISTLFFQPATPTAQTIEDHVKAIADLPGKTAILITTNGREVAARNPDQSLAVGSAAKLAVLAAVNDAVAAGRLNWDQVVKLAEKWRTLPSSTLIAWPEGTPVTIATLRNLMISQSDNMATDALIDLVGRQAVEAIAPRNTPFPTTAELFKLQASAGERGLWEAADADGRRSVLARLDLKPLPDVSDLPGKATGAEWFMTARELCTLLDRVADSPAFAVNPGLATAADWRSVAFKGGSDTGVVNLSTRVVADDGTTHCVIVTWNGPDATLEPLTGPYRGILRQLSTGGGGD